MSTKNRTKEASKKSNDMEVAKLEESTEVKGASSNSRELESVDTIKSSSNLRDITTVAEQLVKAGFTPFKKVEDAVVAIMAGADLGLPPTVAINNIYAIEGKAATGIHIIQSLIRKAGIRMKVLSDCSPVYPVYVKNPSDPKKPILVRKVSIEEIKDGLLEEEKAGSKPVDYVTRIQFIRYFKIPGTNEYEREVHIEPFYKSTADAAGLTSKANWKYLATMMRNRAVANGARFIADDVLHGMYEVTELLDSNNIDYSIDASGKVEDIEYSVDEPKSDIESSSDKEEPDTQ